MNLCTLNRFQNITVPGSETFAAFNVQFESNPYLQMEPSAAIRHFFSFYNLVHGDEFTQPRTTY